jgi:hypothetical protein
MATRDGSILLQMDPATGDPMRFVYRDARHVLEVGADGILIEPTALGRLVTATLVKVPDAWTTTVTVTVPEIRLPRTDAEVTAETPPALPELFISFSTLSTHRTDALGVAVLTGQVDTYATQILFGKAQRGTVEFPSPLASGVLGRALAPAGCPGQDAGAGCIGPLVGAQAVLFDEISGLSYTADTDPRGLFGIDAPPGSYRLSLEPADPGLSCDEQQVVIDGFAFDDPPTPVARTRAQIMCVAAGD